MNKDKDSSRRLPYLKLIELLLYPGYKLKDIKEMISSLRLRAISDAELENIYDECIAVKGGKNMIKNNMKRLLSGKELYKSEDVRKRFAIVEVYDAFTCNPKLINLPFCELLINREKRRFLECSIVYSFPFKQLQKAWYKKYKQELTLNQYKSFCYYLFDLENYSKNEIYQFIEQNSDYLFYEDFKYIFGRSKVNFLTYFDIAVTEDINKSEKQNFGLAKRNIQKKLRSDPNAISNAELHRYHTLEKINKKIMEGDIKMNFARKESHRIHMRIEGKQKVNNLRDKWRDESRRKHMEGPNEQDEIIHP
ncbi:MAG: hypothetical protein HOG24_06390 [Candidatus Cloacimonetes bacterium]|mgnify:CR=1 FL=1|nr:hypothetical protein [Candidatus Cloacimonadota bacterium]